MTNKFEDTNPSEPTPISDSNWDKLDESQRVLLVRQRHEALLARHLELRLSLKDIKTTVNGQVVLVKQQAREVREIKEQQVAHGDLLEKNTSATARTEGKVDQVIQNTTAIVGLFNDAAGGIRIVGRIGEFGKKLAWILVPSGVGLAAWQAFQAWIKSFKGGG